MRIAWSPCTTQQFWTGVTCGTAEDGTENRVVGLSFDGLDMAGELPMSAIASVASLEQFRLVNVPQLTGPLEAASLAVLGRLTVLELCTTGLTGDPAKGGIPWDVIALRGGPDGMTTLRLCGTAFGGVVDAQALSVLTALQLLALDGLELQGAVSSSALSALTSMRWLRITDNPALTLPLGEWLGSMTQLQELDLHAAGVVGEVRCVLFCLARCHISPLTHVHTQLSGSWLGALPQLTQLSLAGNAGVNGTIPAEFDQLGDLRYVDLWGTSVCGAVPADVLSALPSLESLSLGGHDDEQLLTGEFPWASLASTSLQSLRIGAADFSGSVGWAQLGALAGTLQELALERSGFSGTIDSGVASLSQLQRLVLRDLPLHGTVPWESIAQLTMLESLLLEGCGLEGAIDSDALATATANALVGM